MKKILSKHENLKELSHDELEQINGGGVSEVTGAILRYIGRSFNRDIYEQTAWDMCHKM